MFCNRGVLLNMWDMSTQLVASHTDVFRNTRLLFETKLKKVVTFETSHPVTLNVEIDVVNAKAA